MRQDFVGWVNGPFRRLYERQSKYIASSLEYDFPHNDHFALPGLSERLCSYLYARVARIKGRTFGKEKV